MITKAQILANIGPLVAHTTRDTWETPITALRTLRVRKTRSSEYRVIVREGGPPMNGPPATVLISRRAHSAERAATVARWMVSSYGAPVDDQPAEKPRPNLEQLVAGYLTALDDLRALDPKRRLRGQALENARAARRQAVDEFEKALRAEVSL